MSDKAELKEIADLLRGIADDIEGIRSDLRHLKKRADHEDSVRETLLRGPGGSLTPGR